VESNKDDLDTHLSELLGEAGQVLLLNMSLESVKRIVGEGAVWPELSPEDVMDCVYTTILAGSSGKPNKAASGFFSNIIRAPLAGHEAVLPVSEDVRHWHASPRSAVGFLMHAATMDLAAIGPRRALSMPGLSCTVGEQIAALERVAGSAVTARIRREPDPVIQGIVAGWPRDFEPARSVALGFRAESSFDEIIRAHIDDELGGSFVA
jgi:nucleoside-diphosphate-sugar epimerase